MKSHTHSSSRIERGFTLVELLVSIAIIVIITSIVLLRYDKFDSTILLKNAAYDVALTIRDAQVRSVGAVRGSSSEAKHPYGVTFTPGAIAGKEYVTFRYASQTVEPKYDVFTSANPLATGIGTTTIDRSMYVSDVCITVGASTLCSGDGIQRLDVSFRRPEFKALFYAIDGATTYSSTITSATIILESPKGADKFEVHVSQLGQITIKKQ